MTVSAKSTARTDDASTNQRSGGRLMTKITTVPTTKARPAASAPMYTAEMFSIGGCRSGLRAGQPGWRRFHQPSHRPVASPAAAATMENRPKNDQVVR